MNGEAENFRIVITGPTSDSGGMIALTREPSVRRASTIGRRLVDAAADRGDDPVDDPHDVVVVLEDDVRQLELAGPLDVDLARAVDHDLRDRLVAQERLERPEADDLVGDLLEHPDALGAGQGEAFLVDDLAEDLLDLAPDLDLVGQVELGVEVLDDPALDPELDVAERLPDRAPGSSAGGATASAADRRRARRTGRSCRDRRPLTPGRPPGRALSIRFSSDIATDPLPPRGARYRPTDMIIGMRTATSSASVLRAIIATAAATRSPATAWASRRMSWETCGLPVATGRTVRPG